VTLEANPGTVTRASLEGYRAAGVTRLSLGWQSTHDHLLELLGRTHDAAASRASAIAVREAGFTEMSIDLIFAVPGQTMADLEVDLDAVLAMSPEHVSLYGLTYHEGTPFHRARERGAITPVDDQTEAAMFTRIAERLTAAGYRHYEVSNFAKAGHEAVHNSSYWHGTPYLGLGPGAHSFQRDGWRRGVRWETVRNPRRYLETFKKARPVVPFLGMASSRGSVSSSSAADVAFSRPAADMAFREELGPVDLLRERILTGLRLDIGIDLATEPFSAFDLAPAAARAVARGLASREGSRLVPTFAGRLQADTLAELVAP
jgi:coproporphyrinogen III oxidase-like Fe-S oxidoreductase